MGHALLYVSGHLFRNTAVARFVYVYRIAQSMNFSQLEDVGRYVVNSSRIPRWSCNGFVDDGVFVTYF